MKNKLIVAVLGLTTLGALVSPAMADPCESHPHLLAARNAVGVAQAALDLAHCSASCTEEQKKQFDQDVDKAQAKLGTAATDITAACEVKYK